MSQLGPAGKVLVALSLLDRDDNPADLFRFAPNAWEEDLAQYLTELEADGAGAAPQQLGQLIRSWTERSPAKPIHDIHPGWILDAIRDESPRVIGLVCRYLPGSHVRYLLDHLPAEICGKLPSVGESFALPNEIMDNVRNFLEQKFFHANPPSREQGFSCQHIPWMSGRDIKTVIRELGYQEIGRAFANIDAKATQTFLTRFSLEEAKRLRDYLDQAKGLAAAERKAAQQHLVRLNIDVDRAANLSFEIGLSVLAHNVDPDDQQWIEDIVIRLEPKQGYTLRRYVSEAAGNFQADQVEKQQTALLGLIRKLGERNEINQYWQQPVVEAG